MQKVSRRFARFFRARRKPREKIRNFAGKFGFLLIGICLPTKAQKSGETIQRSSLNRPAITKGQKSGSTHASADCGQTKQRKAEKTDG